MWRFLQVSFCDDRPQRYDPDASEHVTESTYCLPRALGDSHRHRGAEKPLRESVTDAEQTRNRLHGTGKVKERACGPYLATDQDEHIVG